jgi:hypothetical protein
LVCWGNGLSNTKYAAVGSSTTSFVTYATINTGNTVVNCDPLYSAISVASVPEKRTWNGTASFLTAHRQIEIYIKGCSRDGNTLPLVELANLPPALRLFDMALLSNQNTVENRTPTRNVTVQGEYYAAAIFRTFLFEANNLITINIINPVTNQLDFDVLLREVVLQSQNLNSNPIRIVIEFKSTGVTITVPNWNSEDVGFGFGHGYEEGLRD